MTSGALVPGLLAEEHLCSQCSKLNLRQYLAPVTLRLNWNLPDIVSLNHNLEVSTSSKCGLCRLLAWSLTTNQTVVPTKIKTLMFERLGQTETLSGSPTASLCMTHSKKPAQRLALYGKDSYRVGARRYTYGRMVQSDRACRELVIQWLEKCKREHSGPCSITPTTFTNYDSMPEYVVDVQEMKIHFADGEKLEYLALSYVWGRIQTLQLLKHNKVKLAKVGSLCDLIDEIPTVIRDAITFTKDLGYKYLWVDTLCICQDDTETKERQIAGMNTVYAQATMTIVALEGHDASHGLSGVRPYETPRSQPMETVHQLRIMAIMPPLSDDLEHSVWRSRAWTFQEEQFSRRILFFTKHQVYFRCQSSTYCEDRFEDCLDVEEGYVEGSFKDGLLHQPHPGAHLSTVANRIWMKMVEDYSKRNFSQDSDRYDAFAGIESQLKQDKFNYPCTLGMPIKHLVRELYWHHLENLAGGRHELRRIPTYPSWSWCGWEGGIVLPRVGLRTEIEKIQISGENSARMYDGNSQLLDSEKLADPPLLPLSVSNEYSKQLVTLSFEAHTSRLYLDTSHFTQDGIILVAPERGKICGIIHCAHLSPQYFTENTNESLECILVASCHRSGSFDLCQYQQGMSEWESWFSDPKINESTRHENISEAYNNVLNQIEIPTRRPSYINPETSKIELEVWLRKRRLRLSQTCNGVVEGITIAIFVILITIAMLAAAALVIALLPIMIVLLILLLLLLWAYEGFCRGIYRNEQWHLWDDAIIMTRFGQWIDETIIVNLPRRAQDAFYQAWSESPNRELYIERESQADYYNVVNIMLVKRRVIDGLEVCERLAIGEMSARCWWKSMPTRRQVILQ